MRIRIDYSDRYAPQPGLVDIITTPADTGYGRAQAFWALNPDKGCWCLAVRWLTYKQTAENKPPTRVFSRPITLLADGGCATQEAFAEWLDRNVLRVAVDGEILFQAESGDDE